SRCGKLERLKRRNEKPDLTARNLRPSGQGSTRTALGPAAGLLRDGTATSVRRFANGHFRRRVPRGTTDETRHSSVRRHACAEFPLPCSSYSPSSPHSRPPPSGRARASSSARSTPAQGTPERPTRTTS